MAITLVRPPEGDRLADVLSGAERIQDEAGDIGSRNRRRDGARADPCGVAAGAYSRRQAGRADDGVVGAALTDRLLLQDLVGVGPSQEQGVEHALDEAANACGLHGRNQVPRALRKDVGGPAGSGEGDAQHRHSGILASGGSVEGVLIEDVAAEHLQARCRLQCGGVACDGANVMPSSQRLRYEFAPLRASGADDEDFHGPKSIPPQNSPQISCLCGPDWWGRSPARLSGAQLWRPRQSVGLLVRTLGGRILISRDLPVWAETSASRLCWRSAFRTGRGVG